MPVETSRPLNVLIVGCGNIAGGFDEARAADALPLTHAGAYARDGRFRLVACVEPNPERRDHFARRWGVEETFDDLDRLAGQAGTFDVISICSPTDRHAADLDAAIALKPKLIFCEKPVTNSSSQTWQAVDRCRREGIRLAINHTRRWDPEVRRLRADLATGARGEVRSIAAIYNKGVLNNGAHLADLLLYLFGPLSVAWAGPAIADFWPDDPTIPFVLLTEMGLPVMVGTGHAADYSFFELTLVTGSGVVRMEDGGLNWQVRHANGSSVFSGYRTLSAAVSSPGGYNQAMLNAVGNIHAALTLGEPLLSTGDTALAAQRLCETIRSWPASAENRDTPS